MEVPEVISFVREALSNNADPVKAVGMQAYMKTAMPFYGVQNPDRRLIIRELKKRFAPGTHDEYLAMASALWELPHREEKYLAQAVATAFSEYVVPQSLPLYRRFIVEGQWWDFVDETATHMIRPLVITYSDATWPEVDGWNASADMWLRRASIICQIGAKDRTDSARLFRFCANHLHEEEFFIRKGIGWALREYAKTDPASVASFLNQHREDMSALSFREASKHIRKLVEE